MEALFWMAKVAHAVFVSMRAEAHPYSASERRVHWRRILADPSQNSRTFASEWFYKAGDDVAHSRLGLLRRWVARRLGFGGRAERRGDGASAAMVDYADLTRGDVRHWLARTLMGRRAEVLDTDGSAELDELVDQLEEAARAPLKPGPRTPGIESMAANIDPLRWRHRPLFYYGITHGLGAAAWTPLVMREAGYERRAAMELRYWYRPPRDAAAAARDTLVFIHGVGIGPAPYVSAMDSLADDGRAVVAVEIGAAAQRVFPTAPPKPARFADLVGMALESVDSRRALVVGHSLGSAFANYIASHEPTRCRVSALVLIDPICTLLHQAKVTKEFVYTPTATLKDAADDYLFKKELFTSIVIARHLVWHRASLWLEACSPQIPTLIATCDDDKIVPVDNVQSHFGSIQARLRGCRVISLGNVGHGGWLTDERAAERLSDGVRALMRESAAIASASEAAAPVVTGAAAASSSAAAVATATLRYTAEATSLASAAVASASRSAFAYAASRHFEGGVGAAPAPASSTMKG